MKMISFCNKKGGVGKTTLCKNIAYKLASENKKVLVIDLDTQASLSYLLQHENIDMSKSLHKVIASDCEINISKVIQSTKYKNIDIIVGGESLRKTLPIMRDIYDNKNWYLVGLQVYKKNIDIFDSYDYVLIDYPSTMQELSLNFLIISDLVVIPINNGIGSYKGLIDLKNSLNHICQKENREVPKLKIILNNVKENEDTILIYKTLEKENLTHFLSKNFINHSRSFVKSENELSSIWTNPYYWRQKQAYEELIAEIL